MYRLVSFLFLITSIPSVCQVYLGGRIGMNKNSFYDWPKTDKNYSLTSLPGNSYEFAIIFQQPISNSFEMNWELYHQTRKGYIDYSTQRGIWHSKADYGIGYSGISAQVEFVKRSKLGFHLKTGPFFGIKSYYSASGVLRSGYRSPGGLHGGTSKITKSSTHRFGNYDFGIMLSPGIEFNTDNIRYFIDYRFTKGLINYGEFSDANVNSNIQALSAGALINIKINQKTPETKLQDTTGLRNSKTTAVYAGFGGTGYSYSINFDRFIISAQAWHLTYRVGISYLSKSYIIPVSGSILYGNKKDFLELEIGWGSRFKGPGKIKYYYHPTVGLNWRHQNKEDGLFIKAGLSNLLNSGNFFHTGWEFQSLERGILRKDFNLWPNVALGWSFI